MTSILKLLHKKAEAAASGVPLPKCPCGQILDFSDGFGKCRVHGYIDEPMEKVVNELEPTDNAVKWKAAGRVL